MLFLARVCRTRLAAASLAALLFGACSEPKPVHPAGYPRNVLLISIDTLRADHCGFMGYDKPTTPFLDSLAARGAVFESHMVNSNNTLVSHASILTGLLPLTHAVKDRQPPLRKGFDTLAEVLQAHGFTTASFTTHPAWLARSFGLDQGFDVVDSDWISAPELLDHFLDWYDDAEPERLFAFLHFYDVHSDHDQPRSRMPYQSTSKLIAQFAGPQPDGFTGCLASRSNCCASEYLAEVSKGVEPLSEEHRRYLIGLYDAGLRKFDDDLRAAFKALERRDLLDDTLIVITSDHGEAFMEHSQLLHNTYHDEIMHVPLLVILPRGGLPALPRVSSVTRSIDIAPTIAELVGLKPIGQGKSLVRCLTDGVLPRRPDVLFTDGTLRSADKRSAYKYANTGKEKFFYDLDSDPDERNNLWRDQQFLERSAKRIERIENRIGALRRWAVAASNAVPSDAEAPVMDPEFARRLRELGYTDSE